MINKKKNNVCKNYFLKEIINSDFAFAKTLNKKNGLNTVNLKINLKKNQFQVLDVFELNTALKQLIRLLFSLQYSKHKFKPHFSIYIWCTNAYLLELINLFLIEFNLVKFIKISEKFPVITTKIKKKNQKILFVIGNLLTKKIKKFIDEKIIPSGIFLVQCFNFYLEKNDSGFYKLQNNFDDYKKLFVILILLETVLSLPKAPVTPIKKKKKKFLKKNNAFKKNYYRKNPNPNFDSKKISKNYKGKNPINNYAVKNSNKNSNTRKQNNNLYNKKAK